MHAKYADIVESREVLDFIAALPEGLYELPAGEPRLQTSATRG